MLVAASFWGSVLIVLALLAIFAGAAYGLSRRGRGVGPHPSDSRRREGDAPQAPGAGRPSADAPDARPRDEA
ncbi:MAG TPA: hypothetical protein VHG69_03970 [Thermoleophilaceae bacterium]|nr:hypothetical protein [Thermoleophilaceae bacterium]